ncbi:MAG: hypothetical protein AAF597_19090, partial [Bacteroidota bacterium]
MFRYPLLLFVLALAPAAAPSLIAQTIEEQKQAVVAEGFALYRLEKAAWNATDIVQAQDEGIADNIGGYITYSDGGLTHCTFYDQQTPPQVLVSLAFDSTFNPAVAVTDYTPRSLTEQELRLTQLRQEGIKALQQDTSLRSYENTSFNLVPIVYAGVPKMYVLTGPQVSGVVVFGNDYLVTFDDEDKAAKVEKLHSDIIPVPYEKDGQPIEDVIPAHTDPDRALMTPTDIC